MAEYKTRKPIFWGNVLDLENEMRDLDFIVYWCGKPEIIKDIYAQNSEQGLHNVADLDESSLEKIDKYLEDKEADGALVLDTFARYNEEKEKTEYWLTVIAYILR